MTRSNFIRAYTGCIMKVFFLHLWKKPFRHNFKSIRLFSQPFAIMSRQHQNVSLH